MKSLSLRRNAVLAAAVPAACLLAAALVMVLLAGGSPMAAAPLQTGPEVSDVALASTSGNDFPSDSLVCSYALGGTATTAATAWILDGAALMIAYLPMEGGATSALLDYSGRGNNATAAGDPAWNASGGFDGNGCFDFDGNDHLDLGNIFPAGPYTKTAWIYYIPGEQYNNIISGQTNHAFWVHSTGGAFRLTSGHNGSWDTVVDPDPFPENTWVFTAVTYDGGTLTLYRNGAPVASASGVPAISSDTRAYIGSFTNSCCWIKGSIDDARIYDRALSPQQIAALYNGGAGGNDLIVPPEISVGDLWQACVTPFSATEAGAGACSNTLTILDPSGPSPCPPEITHYWKLDENPGPPYEDFAGSNDATCVNCPAPTAGMVGGAQYFDGSNDEVYAPDDDSWDWSKDASFSIVYWMKTSSTLADNRVLVARDDATNSLHWWVGYDGTKKARFQLRDINNNGAYIGGKGKVLNDNVWHFIAAVRDNGTDMNRLYVDGAKVDSAYFDYTAGFSGTAELNIGYIDLSGHYRYQGAIDEVATFDAALSDAEILAFYNDGLAGRGYCPEEPVAPVIVSSPVTTALIGHPYAYDVDATGFPAPTYALLVYPSGMTIDPMSGEITWTPAAAGDYDVSVEASNEAGDDTQDFTISVSEPPPCPLDMISYWKLDETAGTTYDDFFGGNDASASPSPPAPSTDAVVGGSQEFNGTANYITAPDNGSFDWAADASFTIECWCRFTDMAGKNKVMVGRDDGGGYPHWWLGAQSGDGIAVFNLLDQSKQGIACYGEAALNDDAWHHLVAVRDEAANMNRLYVDGAKVDSAFFDYAQSFAATTQLDIGYMAYNHTPDYYFHGKLDEIALYDRALTDAEISAHYTNGLAGIGYCEEGEPVPPEITSVPVTDGLVGEPYLYDVDATGYPAPHYALLTYPAGMAIDSLTGLVQWTPGAAGLYDVLVEAHNEAGADSQGYSITVTEPAHPGLEDLVLEATSPAVDDDDDLICGYTLTGSATTAATAWRADGYPIMARYFPMEGGAAAALIDYSGAGGAATPHGDPTWGATAGHDGHGAFVFDGNDDLGGGEHFPTASSYTKTAWVYRTGSGLNGGNNIISGDENAGGHAFWAPDTYGNKLSGGHNATWNIVQDGVALALDTWYFVALSYDHESGLMVLYKNGAMVDSATVAPANRAVTDATVSIGSFGAANGWMWKGTIDDARVYKRALSADQVAALYIEGNDRITASETVIGEEWQACVTPFSADEAGSTYCSNTLVINEVVATLLRSFEARLHDFGVTLEWRLAVEGESVRFFVLRAGGGAGVFAEIAQPAILRDELSFTFRDDACEPGDSYRYRVDVQDEDGRRLLFETDEVSVPSAPLTLYQNYPNPFNPSTAIRFFLPAAGHVSLIVFDAQGRYIATLAHGMMTKGFKEIMWDGKTRSGGRAGSGVYFYRLKAGNEVLTRKMLLVR